MYCLETGEVEGQEERPGEQDAGHADQGEEERQLTQAHGTHYLLEEHLEKLGKN